MNDLKLYGTALNGNEIFFGLFSNNIYGDFLVDEKCKFTLS